MIPTFCLAATALVSEVLKQAGFWQIGAAEIYERRDMVLDAWFLAPRWLTDKIREIIDAAISWIKTFFSTIFTFLLNLFSSEG